MENLSLLEIKEYYKKRYGEVMEKYNKACLEGKSFIELSKLLGELVEAKLNFEDATRRYEEQTFDIKRLKK